jgi:bla regulator protein blaR1
MTGAIINHIWQSTLFVFAVGLFVGVFRQNRARVRYWLWFSASLKFLLPFSLLMGLGSHLGWAPVTKTAAVATAPSVPITIMQVSQPFAGNLRILPSPRLSRDWAEIGIFAAWGLGFAGIMLFRVRGWIRVQSALRGSSPIDMPAGLEVRSSPGLLGPAVVGLWRPVLLLPAEIGNRLTPAQLEAVLAHEFCHARRRDNLWSTIHMLVETIFWFHPAVWWIGARLLEERERACDEEVLSLGGEPRVYAEGILNVCRLYAESSVPCVSGVTGANLKKRIEVIMANRMMVRLNFAKKVVLAVAGIVALTGPIVIGVMNAPYIRAQSAAAAAIPQFETVSIQPGCAAPGAEQRKGGDGARKTGAPAPPSPGSLNLNCSTVAGIIHPAYGTFAGGHPLEEANPLHYVDAIPMSGGPAWIYTDRYQIHAKAAGDPSLEMMRGPMMQALLEDRLQLKVRRETREVPAYALTVARGGTKLQPYAGDCIGDFVVPLPAGRNHCRDIGTGERKQASFTPHFAPDSVVKDLDAFALWLFVITDRPVINKTALTGRFFLDVVFAPDQATPGALARLAIMTRRNGGISDAAAAPSNPPGPSIFAALEQQLGLKLEPVTAFRDYLIVEHIERPRAD